MNEVGALVLGGVVSGVGGGVAFWGVVTQRVIGRRHATLELIHRQQTDKDIIDARNRFIELAGDDAAGGLAKYASKEHEGKPDTQKIILVLNQYELISIGIQRGALDYVIYKRWNKSSVLRYWNHAAPFVHALRSRMNNDALYHEFEQMAWWLKERKMPRRNRWFGLIF